MRASNLLKRFLTSLKDLFTKNVLIKVLAIVFAVLLWGYVLYDLNPYRVKTLSGVSTSFDGEAELLAQGLCIRGDREEILKDVDVAVRTQLRNYADLGASAVNASISLKNISQPQEYQLPVNASMSSALGFVNSVSPSTVTVEIDSLVTKTIPISCVLENDVPEGYWADKENVSYTTRIDIQGAKTDMAKVSRAECVIDLAGKTSTIYGTFDLILYDSENNIIDSSIVIGSLPAATVRLNIRHMKKVPITIESALIGSDSLAANYELASVTIAPEEVRIVGDEAALKEVDSITMEPISISGAKESMTVESQLIVPDSVTLLDSRTVTLALNIQEMTDTASFVQMPISVTNLGKGLVATVTPAETDIDLFGRVSILSVVKRSDVKVDVDVTGLSEGTYELPVTVFVKNDEATIELAITSSVETAKVTITAK